MTTPKGRALALLGLAAVVMVTGSLWYAARAPQARSGLQAALVGRGAVLWARRGAPDAALAHVGGVSLTRLSRATPLADGLSGDDPAALVAALKRAGQVALVVDAGAVAAPPDSVWSRLSSYARVPGLRGLYLAPDVCLYGVDPWQALPDKLQLALATVARGMLAGKRAPRLASFPEPLRQVQHVEVMVMLRAGKRPRLWRSARGSSVAQALLTAARVARTRWGEREQAMGEPLDEALQRLTVEVSLLQDDGRFGSRDPAFLDRVFGPDHGVAFERKGAWRYLLPDATREAGGGHAVGAFARLLGDEGLEASALQSPDLHPYRLAVNVLAISPPPPAGDDGLGPVEDPDAVLR